MGSKKIFLILLPLLFFSGLIVGLVLTGGTRQLDNSESIDRVEQPLSLLKTEESDILPDTDESLDLPLASTTRSQSRQQESSTDTSALPFTPDEQVNIKVYEERNKAVVNITREILAYNWFLEPVPQESGVGSGTIIDKEKPYILTNYHVIRNARTIYVTTHSNNKYKGQLIGHDPENDLALLTIPTDEPLDFDYIPVAPSDLTLKVGQKVLAIGNPFGLERTLTTGIISALGRSVKNDNLVIRNMIQTDAAINPGNSGSPLLNDKGQLIGINTSILSPSSGSVGLGFAVSHATIARVIGDLIRYGKVNRGWITMKFQPLFEELVEYADYPVSKGLLVTNIQKGSALDKKNFRAPQTKTVRYGRTIIPLGGDIITKVKGVEVWNLTSLLEALESTRPGEKVSVSYYRGSTLKEATVSLDERPDGLFD